ncbi:MAG TPA: substrate-binding domain-containing protein [Candidatus Angelobacter sp.]
MKKYSIVFAACISAVVWVAVATCLGVSSDGDVAVVVNPDNPVDSLTSAELRKIFAGERRSWNSDLPIFLLVRAPQSREREILLTRVLKMTESEYKQYWVKKVYSGEVLREPLTLLSNGMQLEAVRAEKGGIALINFQDVRQGVKVVKVDGHLPGAPGYPLR